MNETIRLQILAIRESGVTNMFDIPALVRKQTSEAFTNWLTILMTTRPSTFALS